MLITDINGKIVKSINSNVLNGTVNVSNISNGTYFILFIKDGTRIGTKKIIINK